MPEFKKIARSTLLFQEFLPVAKNDQCRQLQIHTFKID